MHVLIDGNVHAQAGDLAGAAERYLDVVRFGLCTHVRNFYWVLYAIELLEQLVAFDHSTELPLPEIASELMTLERAIESPALALHRAKLAVEAELLRAADGLERPFLDEAPPYLEFIMRRRAVIAHAIGRLDDVYGEAEYAAERHDVESWARVEELLHAYDWGAGASGSVPSRNPIVVRRYPRAASAGDGVDKVKTYLRCLLVAIALEQQTPPRDAAKVELPEDPFLAPAKLKLEIAADGKGRGLEPRTDSLPLPAGVQRSSDATSSGPCVKSQ